MPAPKPQSAMPKKAPRRSHPVAPAQEDTVVFSARVPPEFRKQVKAAAVDRGQSMQTFGRLALANQLELGLDDELRERLQQASKNANTDPAQLIASLLDQQEARSD